MHPALGIVDGEPFGPVRIRPGLRGILSRLKRWDQRTYTSSDVCVCGKRVPGYSFCSRECLAEFGQSEDPW